MILSSEVWLVCLGVVLGALAADGITGLVHWACDTWGDERTPWLGPGLIRAFREHHRDPRAMLDHSFFEVNREPLIAAGAAVLLLSIPPLRQALAGHALLQGFLGSLVLYGSAANQLHLWAHSDHAPVPVRWLQRRGLVLSPSAHASHHHPPYSRAYCISTGWLNPLLDALGFWRGLERLVFRLTHSAPRASDRREALD